MLADDLFDERLAAVEQSAVEPRPVGDVAGEVAVHAESRASHRLLRDDRAVAQREGAHVVGVVVRHDHPLALQVRGERAVEGDLVVEEVPVRRIVEPHREAVRDGAGHVGRALGAGEHREVVVDVVLEPDASHAGLPEHVDDDAERAATVPPARTSRAGDEAARVHASRPLPQEGESGRQGSGGCHRVPRQFSQARSRGAPATAMGPASGGAGPTVARLTGAAGARPGWPGSPARAWRCPPATGCSPRCT